MTEALIHSVIFLEPPTLRIDDLEGSFWIERFVKWLLLTLLLKLIVALESSRLPSDVGPYTHCAISNGALFMDATLSDEFPAPEPLTDLGARPYDVYLHTTDGLLEAVYTRAEDVATGEPEMWRRFSVRSLLWLISIGLLAESRLDFIARFIVQRLDNQPGLYCSEFVAEVIASFGGQPLIVTVDRDRVFGWVEQTPEATFFNRLANRNALLSDEGAIDVDPMTAWNSFQMLNDVEPEGFEPASVPVGYAREGDPPMVPPFLVGLSDLVNSPQLQLQEGFVPGPE